MEKLTIGEMAELNNISTQTLRLYTKMGLISPIEVDEVTGYRFYDIRQSYVIDIIGYLKSLGMGLKEIKNIIENPNIDEIRESLQENLININNEFIRLRIAKKTINTLLKRFDLYDSMNDQCSVVLENIPQRVVHCFEINANFQENNGGQYEEILRNIKKTIISKNLPLAYFSNVSSMISKENILKNEFITTKVFINADSYTKTILPYEIIQGGDYLCIYFENFINEKRLAKKLLSTVKERGYQIAGDYVCETIIEFPLFQNAERNSLIKIQVPVTC